MVSLVPGKRKIKSNKTPHLLRVRLCSKSFYQSYHLVSQQPHVAVWELLFSPFVEEEPAAQRG